jgi:hypothetical protein
VHRLAAFALALSLVVAFFALAPASSEPGTGAQVPTLAEHNAVEARVTDLAARVAELEEWVATAPSPEPTPTEEPTPTPDPEPTEEPTPTPDPEPTPEPPASDCVKPTVDNTGPTGTLTAYTGPTYVPDGAVIENKTVTGDLIVTGDNVTVRNVKVTGKVGVMESVGARLSNIETPEFFISSAQDVVLEKSRISDSTTDSMHVTSDGTSMNRDIVIRGNLVHNPNPGQEEHYDGLQVRGVNGLDLLCNNFDLGPAQFPYNAAVYLEPANGGHRDVVVDNNWLMGGGHIFHYGAASVTPDDTRLTNNRLGGDPYWGAGAVCHNSPGVVPGVQTGNTVFGEPATPCS